MYLFVYTIYYKQYIYIYIVCISYVYNILSSCLQIAQEKTPNVLGQDLMDLFSY